MFIGKLQAADAEAPTPRPLPEAQLMELRDRWQRFNEPVTLKPGDACREKRGMGIIRFEVRDRLVMMLWRMLDQTNQQDQQLVKNWVKKVSVSQVDCVVAYVTDEGTTLVFELRELAQLEPWEPAL